MLMREDNNVGVRNTLHTKFDLAVALGITLGKGSLKHVGPTVLLTNGAIASTKEEVSMNKLIYFIKTDLVEAPGGVSSDKLSPSIDLVSKDCSAASDKGEVSRCSKVAFNQCYKSQNGPERAGPLGFPEILLILEEVTPRV